MSRLPPNPALKQLEVLIGEWEVEVPRFPGQRGQARFEWLEGGSYLRVHADAPDPAPSATLIIRALPRPRPSQRPNGHSCKRKKLTGRLPGRYGASWRMFSVSSVRTSHVSSVSSLCSCGLRNSRRLSVISSRLQRIRYMRITAVLTRWPVSSA
jgi:hypothetical protein